MLHPLTLSAFEITIYIFNNYLTIFAGHGKNNVLWYM